MIKIVAFLFLAIASVKADCSWGDTFSCGRAVASVVKQCYNGNMGHWDIVDCAHKALAIKNNDGCFDCFCYYVPLLSTVCEIYSLNEGMPTLSSSNTPIVSDECVNKKKPCYLGCLELMGVGDFQ